ncbi:MAG: SWIM zinc finger family protein [Quadrisphaera sp.]
MVLTLGTWDAETRGELADALAADPSVLTAVLGGTLPEAFEQLCLDAGLVLLPRSLSDLRTSCTCPDLVEPCKHAAAVVYLLAERLDDDPFTVLRLRGVDRDGLLSLVAERRAALDDDGGTGDGGDDGDGGGRAAPARRAAIGGAAARGRVLLARSPAPAAARPGGAPGRERPGRPGRLPPRTRG